MTRDDLIIRLSKQLEWEEKDAKKALDALIDTLVDELLAGSRIDLADFGLFQTKRHSEYVFVDRDTNERYLMPPFIEVVFEESNPEDTTSTVQFLADGSLEKEVNGSFALFEPTLINEGVQFPGVPVISNEPEQEPVEIPIEVPEEKPEMEQEIIPKAGEVNEPNDLPVAEKVAEPMASLEAEPERVAERKRRRSVSIWMPVIGGVAIAVAVLFFFKPFANGKTVANDKKRRPKMDTVINRIVADTIARPKETHSLPPKKITIKEGQTLRLLAEEVYGHREFWIYIYLENQQNIKNPHVISPGLELLLPRSSEYDMNPSNPLSIEKANKVAHQVFLEHE